MAGTAWMECGGPLVKSVDFTQEIRTMTAAILEIRPQSPNTLKLYHSTPDLVQRLHSGLLPKQGTCSASQIYIAE